MQGRRRVDARGSSMHARVRRCRRRPGEDHTYGSTMEIATAAYLRLCSRLTPKTRPSPVWTPPSPRPGGWYAAGAVTPRVGVPRWSFVLLGLDEKTLHHLSSEALLGGEDPSLPLIPPRPFAFGQAQARGSAVAHLRHARETRARRGGHGSAWPRSPVVLEVERRPSVVRGPVHLSSPSYRDAAMLLSR